MNNTDRKKLEIAMFHLSNAQLIISELKDSEREKFDNLNEGLQASEKGQKLEAGADSLDYIHDDIENIVDSLTEIIGG